MAANSEATTPDVPEGIMADIRTLSAHLGREYAIDNLPEESEIADQGADCMALLRQIRANIAGHNKKRLFLQDQHNLSAFMKATNGDGEMTEELRRWWINRY